MTKWFLKRSDVDINLMSKALKISPTLATVLANKGIKTKSEAEKLLNPKIKDLHDSSQFKDIDKAVSLIVKTINDGKKIAIYGDYDVDGVMSASILYKALKAYGADIICYIPHREEEGYGLNVNAIDKLYKDEIDLIITCDNGIASIDEIKHAKKLGLKVIVIDHHEPAFSKHGDENIDIIPDADAVIDPKQSDCKYPFKLMCAAGISYKFVKYFYERMEKELENEKEYLILASIATICDIVDLVEENRIIAKHGLKFINTNHNTNIGLKALIKERGISDKQIGSFDIGYVIGPCINASGRLETAEISVKLFTCEDEDVAIELAKKLILLNDERKALTIKSAESVMENIKADELEKVLVVYDKDMHESIAGIVAGRIKDRFYRPTIVIAPGVDFMKGSARSIKGYNIFEELYKCKDLFERFGGHEMAAGFSIKSENIEILRKRLNDNCNMVEEDFVRTIRIEKALDLSQATFTLADELRTLEPFGKENREPLFGAKGLTADLVETIGENKKTLRFTFTLEDNRKIKAVCFNKIDYFIEQLGAKYGQNALDKFQYGRIMNIDLDMLYSVGINEYNNNTYVNLIINDFRI